MHLKSLNIVFNRSKKIFFTFSKLLRFTFILFYFFILYASIYFYYFTKAHIVILKSFCYKSCCQYNYFSSNNFRNCKKISRVTFFKNFAFESAISKQLHYIYNIASIVIITLDNNFNKIIY